MNPEKNMPASRVSMAYWTACVSDREIIDSTMPRASAASSTRTTVTATHATWPCKGTPSSHTADATSTAPTDRPTVR